MASLGLESRSMVVPFRWITTFARNVSSLRSLTMTCATLAPRSPIIESIRSWVIGRGSSLPWSFIAIESASTGPIQMGRYLLACSDLRTITRWWLAGFIRMRSMVISSMSTLSLRWMCVCMCDQLEKPCSTATTR